MRAAYFIRICVLYGKKCGGALKTSPRACERRCQNNECLYSSRDTIAHSAWRGDGISGWRAVRVGCGWRWGGGTSAALAANIGAGVLVQAADGVWAGMKEKRVPRLRLAQYFDRNSCTACTRILARKH